MSDISNVAQATEQSFISRTSGLKTKDYIGYARIISGTRWAIRRVVSFSGWSRRSCKNFTPTFSV